MLCISFTMRIHTGRAFCTLALFLLSRTHTHYFMYHQLAQSSTRKCRLSSALLFISRTRTYSPCPHIVLSSISRVAWERAKKESSQAPNNNNNKRQRAGRQIMQWKFCPHWHTSPHQLIVEPPRRGLPQHWLNRFQDKSHRFCNIIRVHL